MPKKKKVTKRKVVKKPVAKKRIIPKKDRRPGTERILIDNFVSMQKVMVHLTEKFSDLTKKIDGLLALFEGAAKSVMNKEFHPIDEKSKRELITKIDAIMEQNKILAKGLTLIHDSNLSTGYAASSNSESPRIPSRLNQNTPPKRPLVKEDEEPFDFK